MDEFRLMLVHDGVQQLLVGFGLRVATIERIENARSASLTDSVPSDRRFRLWLSAIARSSTGHLTEQHPGVVDRRRGMARRLQRLHALDQAQRKQGLQRFLE